MNRKAFLLLKQITERETTEIYFANGQVPVEHEPVEHGEGAGALDSFLLLL